MRTVRARLDRRRCGPYLTLSDLRGQQYPPRSSRPFGERGARRSGGPRGSILVRKTRPGTPSLGIRHRRAIVFPRLAHRAFHTDRTGSLGGYGVSDLLSIIGGVTGPLGFVISLLVFARDRPRV